ncbi:unnamed protein product [Calypogeia fissa]
MALAAMAVSPSCAISKTAVVSSGHPLSSSSSPGSGWVQSSVPVRRSASATPCSIVATTNANTKTTAKVMPSRRLVASGILAAGIILAGNASVDVEEASAVSSSRRALRSEQIPESEYETMPSGLKYYDIKVGSGAVAQKGSRVAIHYVVKWKGITFMTSRQGMGVTGGTPYGFDVGASDLGMVLKGLDLGVQGMRVGGQRMLICPPELAYGNKGVQEIPPNATLEFNVELLSIKQDSFGARVKLVEG